MAALPLSTDVSQASKGDTEYRVRKVQYGNGYSQRALDGLNTNQSTWSVSWENLTAAEFDTVTAAFDAARGIDYFTWQPPGDTATKKFIVPKYSRIATSGEHYTVSASLEEVFDL